MSAITNHNERAINARNFTRERHAPGPATAPSKDLLKVGSQTPQLIAGEHAASVLTHVHTQPRHYCTHRREISFRTFEIFSNLGSVNKLKESSFTIPRLRNIRPIITIHYALADTTNHLPSIAARFPPNQGA